MSKKPKRLNNLESLHIMQKPQKVAIIGNIRAEDDYVHDTQNADNFVETNLFYYAGKTASDKIVGGIIRVANKPNQGQADGTILYFPGDGSALFNFENPDISENRNWQVAGWDLNVVKPGGFEYGAAYQGQAFHLSVPHLLAEPKRAFKQPKVNLDLRMTHIGKSPMVEFKYNIDKMDAGMQAISDTKGLHQLTSFAGSVALGDAPQEAITGFGWRDHNWGPRNWQAFPKHAFYTGNFNDANGFVLFQTEGGKGYFMHDGPETLHQVVELDMVTDYLEDGREPVAMRADIRLDNGAHHVVEGQKIDFIPLRNRRENMTTHLGYSLWRYQLDGGEEGFGIAEHMSQEA